MGIKSKYRVQVDQRIYQEDFPLLPPELQEDFKEYCESIFVEDPYDCFGFPNHGLCGKLKDCRALEIEWDGNPNAYRVVYRVLEKPAPRRVVVLSFARHDKSLDGSDPPYDKAKERLGRDKKKKR